MALSQVFSRRADRRRDDQCGVAMVEFALVLPFIMVLLLGMFTGGLAYSRQNSLQNAARETARYGAVSAIDGDISAYLLSVALIAQEAATGDLAIGTDNRLICVAFVYPDGDATINAEDTTTKLVLTTDNVGVETVEMGGCFADGRPNSERRVQVQIQRDTELEAVIFTTTITLNAESIARYEREEG